MSYANSLLPDTQELSEDIDSQTMYSAIEMLPVWATMSFLPAKLNMELRRTNNKFGREADNDFVFDSKNLPKYCDRMSKCHFTIEREGLETDGKGEASFGPAIITCVGRNGILVNQDKLQIGDRQILAHNDKIKLTKTFELFKFQYQHLPQEIQSLPKALLAKYFIDKQIGSGGCGTVRLVHNIKTLKKYAMKTIRKETNPMIRDRDATNEKIRNEVQIMKTLDHPHVLSLVDFYETNSYVMIIMDYLEGRDMLYRITRGNPQLRRLSEMDAKFFFLQACRGLKYLHDSRITHRDIKPDNILLTSMDPDAIVKISDFGLSKIIAADSMKTICGTQLYVAPEILMSSKYTNKVDIWSLGCLLFAMLSGSVPFNDDYGPPDVNTQIKNAMLKFRQRSWNEVTRYARDLIRRMLQKEPESRPSIDEVLKHPWLRCDETVERANRLYRLDDTLTSNDTELEQTMVNITLKDSDKSAVPPPLKKRRFV